MNAEAGVSMCFSGGGAPPSHAPNQKDRAVVMAQECTTFAGRLVPLLPCTPQRQQALEALETAFMVSLFAVRLAHATD